MRLDKICYIVGAMADRLPDIPRDNSLVIAADGGLVALKRVGIEPDLIVGDFDSLGWIPEGENVIKHPVMKDDTDMMLAVKLAFQRGYRNIHIFGGLGGRTDHTIANIQTLAYIAGQGGTGFLSGGGEVMTVVKNGCLTFPAHCEGTVSVFAFGGIARGVCEDGLLYGLDNARLTADDPMGVSNEFVGSESRISVHDGMLLVIWTESSKLPIVSHY